MAKILKLSPRSANNGSVYCKELGVHFPALHRGILTTTEQHLEQAGLHEDDQIKPGVSVYFELNTESTQYLGDITWEHVSHIRSKDQSESIVIRRHQNERYAWSYLKCYFDTVNVDYTAEDPQFGIYETKYGIFTLIHIQTMENWGGPIVFYLSEMPNGINEWAYIIDSNGKRREPSDFGY